jgi:choline kinase
MKALILAAGMGERLGALTKNTPKSLLEIGEGTTVIEYQLDQLADRGVDEAVIVVGYKAEQIEAKLKDYRRLAVRTVFNPFFDVSNNLVSAWMARAEMQDDFLLINGDDVFKPHVIDDLTRSVGDIVLLIDRKAEYDDDDMKVITSGDRIYAISKQIDAGEANGESIGMMVFRDTGVERFRGRLEAMVRESANRQVFYLAALQELMAEGFPINFVQCDPDDWAEIDFHPELHQIRREIERFNDNVKAWAA